MAQVKFCFLFQPFGEKKMVRKLILSLVTIIAVGVATSVAMASHRGGCSSCANGCCQQAAAIPNAVASTPTVCAKVEACAPAKACVKVEACAPVKACAKVDGESVREHRPLRNVLHRLFGR